MNTNVLNQIRENLSLKHSALTSWLFSTPAEKRSLQIGPASDTDVQAHLETLETAISEAESGDLGICDVCHGYVDDELLQVDYTACVCLDHMTGDEQRTLEFELELAIDVQRSLLPQQPPDFPGVQIAAFSRPAQLLGGDYFDFFRFADNSYGFAIADVAGHGISASLHMASMQTMLRAFGPSSYSPNEVVARMHRLLVHNTNFTTFITVFLAAYDPHTRRLTYTNAGHNPPMLIRNGEVEWLRPIAPAVGLVEDARFGVASIQLQPADTLVLYTDGFTEATSPEAQEFGPDRLAQVACDAASLPVLELARALRQEVEAFAGGAALPDDLTLVVSRFND